MKFAFYKHIHIHVYRVLYRVAWVIDDGAFLMESRALYISTYIYLVLVGWDVGH